MHYVSHVADSARKRKDVAESSQELKKTKVDKQVAKSNAEDLLQELSKTYGAMFSLVATPSDEACPWRIRCQRCNTTAQSVAFRPDLSEVESHVASKTHQCNTARELSSRFMSTHFGVRSASEDPMAPPPPPVLALKGLAHYFAAAGLQMDCTQHLLSKEFVEVRRLLARRFCSLLISACCRTGLLLTASHQCCVRHGWREQLVAVVGK
jgi:hypothetical protein